MQKAAFLLKIPYDDFAQVPDAFQAMVSKHLELNVALEKNRADRSRLPTEIASNPVSGLRSSSFRNTHTR